MSPFITPEEASAEGFGFSKPTGPTGPRTPEGKARSSQNAIKHNLTGKSPYRTEIEKAEWEQHTAGYFEHYAPAGTPETVLVQAIADDQFRLIRGRMVENAIFAEHVSEDDAEAFKEHHRRLSNLTLYMGRIQRLIDRSTKSLADLQKERRAREFKARDEAKWMARAAWEENRCYQHDIDGDPGSEFVFSNDDLACEVTREDRIENTKNPRRKAIDQVKPLMSVRQAA